MFRMKNIYSFHPSSMKKTLSLVALGSLALSMAMPLATFAETSATVGVTVNATGDTSLTTTNATVSAGASVSTSATSTAACDDRSVKYSEKLAIARADGDAKLTQVRADA